MNIKTTKQANKQANTIEIKQPNKQTNKITIKTNKQTYIL